MTSEAKRRRQASYRQGFADGVASVDQKAPAPSTQSESFQQIAIGLMKEIDADFGDSPNAAYRDACELIGSALHAERQRCADVVRNYKGTDALLVDRREIYTAILSDFSDAPPQTNVDVEAKIASVVQSVNEWDDRTSPDDYPDHLLITSEELAEILRNFADTLEGRDNG